MSLKSWNKLECFLTTSKYWSAQGQDRDDVLKAINISASHFSLSSAFLWSGFGLVIIPLEWLHTVFLPLHTKKKCCAHTPYVVGEAALFRAVCWESLPVHRGAPPAAEVGALGPNMWRAQEAPASPFVRNSGAEKVKWFCVCLRELGLLPKLYFLTINETSNLFFLQIYGASDLNTFFM